MRDRELKQLEARLHKRHGELDRELRGGGDGDAGNPSIKRIRQTVQNHEQRLQALEAGLRAVQGALPPLAAAALAPALEEVAALRAELDGPSEKDKIKG